MVIALDCTAYNVSMDSCGKLVNDALKKKNLYRRLRIRFVCIHFYLKTADLLFKKITLFCFIPKSQNIILDDHLIMKYILFL